MANKILYISFDICNKNQFFIINYQVHKYRIAALFKTIDIADFNTLFICLWKYYIQYIIGIQLIVY